MTERTLAVDYLARVEGEGAFRVAVEDGRVVRSELRIFEPPRYFESFLRGRAVEEAPDITARICGICPVAYQMSASHAIERAAGVRLPEGLRALRRLLYCAEWIESHALHIYLLHAPDFLGYPDAVRLAKDHPEAVRRGLELKKAGNALMEMVGGRAIHPVNVRVGGFYRVPSLEEALGIRPTLERALALAEETGRFATGLPMPPVAEEYEFVALRGPGEYPLNEGDIVSSRGLRIPQERFEEEFEEVQRPHSNALQCLRKDGTPYLVGPLARFALNRDLLLPRSAKLAGEIGLTGPVQNPFRSIQVRAVETAYACEEALRILAAYRPPEVPSVPAPGPFDRAPAAAATEAPRGILYHRYRIDGKGHIEEAKIVAPTSQNQARIELDLCHLVERSLALDDATLTGACEKAIRNHDPCISCATHFLDLTIERRGPSGGR